jgi:hypothetical protein
LSFNFTLSFIHYHSNYVKFYSQITFARIISTVTATTIGTSSEEDLCWSGWTAEVVGLGCWKSSFNLLVDQIIKKVKGYFKGIIDSHGIGFLIHSLKSYLSSFNFMDFAQVKTFVRLY